MKVGEFRSLTKDMRQIVVDWQACVDADERQNWKERGSRFLATFMNASCPKATPKDQDDRLQAYQDYIALFATSTGIGASAQQTSMSRASNYNKSAGRAVRLARAARGAMRRGYF